MQSAQRQPHSSTSEIAGDQVTALVSDPGSLLRSLLASSGDCIKILDLDGNLIFMTEGGQRIMEVTDFGKIKGCPWPDFWQNQGHADAKAAIAAAKAGRAARFQGFATTMAGTPKWWDVNVTPIFGPDGKPEKILSISRDITRTHQDAEAIRSSEERFETFAQAMPNQVWSSTPDGLLDWFNEQVYSFSGLAYDDLKGAGWARMVHPEDIGEARESWGVALSEGTQYQTQFRLRRADGAWRWHLARALPITDSAGVITRWIGTNTDIDDQKASEAQKVLLTNELEHRMKNTMAMISAIANQTFRSATTKDEAQSIFEARLRTLNHAHDLLTRSSWTSASMPVVVEGSLAPHRSGEGRIRIHGPQVELTAKQALALALALHELATNAVKYGALSTPGGKVDVTWQHDAADSRPALAFEWRESGGPAVTTPTRQGFGTRLIERTLSADFGGTATLEFRPEGLICRFDNRTGPAS